MNSLIIDCSFGMNLYVLNGEKEYLYINSDQQKHSDEILIELEKLLNEAGLKISDIQNIGVCIGPGSFTGVRVAISVCKGLAIGLGAKVFACSNLDLFEIKNIERAVLVLDGFAKFVYARVFENGSFKDACVEFSEIEKLAKKQGFEVYAFQEKVQNMLKSSEICYQNAQNITKNVFLEKFNKDEFVEVNQICPVYLRASQAEIEREKKLAGAK